MIDKGFILSIFKQMYNNVLIFFFIIMIILNKCTLIYNCY